MAEELLFALLRYEIFGEELPEGFVQKLTAESLKELFILAKNHDMAHLAADALEKIGVLKEGSKAYDAFRKYLTMALFRHESQKFAAENMYAAFEQEGIDFIPLKGAVLRYLYPEPWMRTSSDVDVLVRKEDVERAAMLCIDKLGYTDKSVGPHDVTFFSPGNVHIELHYDLVERNTEANDVMADVFETAKKAEGFEHKLIMDDALLYFYHIAHVEKHFLNGGCGIRPIADLMILDGIKDADKAKRDALLKKAELLTFADGMRELSRVWFADKAPTELSRRLGKFILEGGTFGNTDTRVAIARADRNKFSYVWKRLFPAMWLMKPKYPILKKYPILLPAMYVKRIFDFLTKGRASESVNEVKINTAIDEKTVRESRWLMKKLDILSDADGII